MIIESAWLAASKPVAELPTIATRQLHTAFYDILKHKVFRDASGRVIIEASSHY